jgi:hypothetical protein
MGGNEQIVLAVCTTETLYKIRNRTR